MSVNPIMIVIIVQLLFTASDLVGRYFMAERGFTLTSFFSAWFIGYLLLRNIAMFGQLYIFSKIQLGHTMALFGATSIVLANMLGFFLLKEALSMTTYLGVTLAITAFLVLAIRI